MIVAIAPDDTLSFSVSHSSLCHAMGQTYLNTLRGSAIFSEEQCRSKGLLEVSKDSGSLVNYAWNELKIPSLSIGLACCAVPPEDVLGHVWDRHRPSLVRLLSTSLQGINVTLEGVEPPPEHFTVLVHEEDFRTVVSSRSTHFWRLMKVGP